MAVRQHFLGWDRPVLHAAVLWMRQQAALRQHHDTHLLDLADWLVVVPGSQAQRRLGELLAGGLPGETEDARPAVISPPAIVTLGQLPQMLYDADALLGDRAIADDLSCTMAWWHALDQADRNAREALLPHWPDRTAFARQWAYAQRLAQTHQQLAGAATDFQALSRGGMGHEREREQWAILADFEKSARDVLDAHGLVARHRLHVEALAQNSCRLEPPRRLILLAIAQMVPVTRRMIEAIAPEQLEVLIAAPSDHADGFDAFGQLESDYWATRQVTVDDRAIVMVDQEPRLPQALLYELSERAADTLDWHLDALTIGVGDQALAKPLIEAMTQADLPVRYAGGQALMQSRPVAALRAWQALATEGNFARLGDLLRHPDMENALRRWADAATHDADAPDPSPSCWPGFLDSYIAKHIPATIDQPALGDDREQQQIEMVLQWLADLSSTAGADTPDKRADLSHWARGLRQWLLAIYGPLTLDGKEPEDQRLIDALEQVSGALERMETGHTQHWMPKLTMAQALGLVLETLENLSLPEPADARAAQITGFLELPLDDAPHLMLMGVNEGRIPSSFVPDPLLPDRVRQALGLDHDRSRYARDLLYFNTAWHTRREGVLFLARRSDQGDPLHISRLLLACDHETRLRRIDRFYAEHGLAPGMLPTLNTSVQGSLDSFGIVVPRQWKPFPERISVTAFRTYLQCPYRFYLRHIERLQAVSDQVHELDPAAFGTLTHDVLEAFCETPQAQSDDAQVVDKALQDLLNGMATVRYGKHPPASVRLQIEQLRPRLTAFARWHAQSRQEQWTTLKTESAMEHAWEIDGTPVILCGRIDRIDTHPEHGYRIIDYKTSDTLHKPDAAHLRRDGTWKDLQLPLYLVLAGSLIDPERTALGYVALPRKTEQSGWYEAPKVHANHEQAFATARQIIRDIRQNIFWPPNPDIDDDFSPLCAAQASNFRELVQAAAMPGGGR